MNKKQNEEFDAGYTADTGRSVTPPVVLCNVGGNRLPVIRHCIFCSRKDGEIRQYRAWLETIPGGIVVNAHPACSNAAADKKVIETPAMEVLTRHVHCGFGCVTEYQLVEYRHATYSEWEIIRLL